MTYTFEVEADGQRLTAVLFGGPGLWTLQEQHRQENGYPHNRQDFARSLEYLKTLDIDIWLGAHPGQNSTFSKYERLRKGEKPNPFIDSGGWRKFISNLESDFQRLSTGE